MHNLKLLHTIRCCFFQFLDSPVALKMLKKIGPQEKVEMTPLIPTHIRDTYETQTHQIITSLAYKRFKDDGYKSIK